MRRVSLDQYSARTTCVGKDALEASWSTPWRNVPDFPQQIITSHLPGEAISCSQFGKGYIIEYLSSPFLPRGCSPFSPLCPITLSSSGKPALQSPTLEATPVSPRLPGLSLFPVQPRKLTRSHQDYFRKFLTYSCYAVEKIILLEMQISVYCNSAFQTLSTNLRTRGLQIDHPEFVRKIVYSK